MIGYHQTLKRRKFKALLNTREKFSKSHSKELKMMDSPDKVDSFGEEDLGTLILVNADDSAVGSVSFADRAASLSSKSSQAIHRTASLYVFDASEKGAESNSGRILLSASNFLRDRDSDQPVSCFLARKSLLCFI